MPLTPNEVLQLSEKEKRTRIPEWVTATVDRLLVEKASLHSTFSQVRLTQTEVVDALMATGNVSQRQDIFDQHLLDFEPLYRDSGWDVRYDKPAYNESYQAFWIFEPLPRQPYRQVEASGL